MRSREFEPVVDGEVGETVAVDINSGGRHSGAPNDPCKGVIRQHVIGDQGDVIRQCRCDFGRRQDIFHRTGYVFAARRLFHTIPYQVEKRPRAASLADPKRVFNATRHHQQVDRPLEHMLDVAEKAGLDLLASKHGPDGFSGGDALHICFYRGLPVAACNMRARQPIERPDRVIGVVGIGVLVGGQLEHACRRVVLSFDERNLSQCPLDQRRDFRIRRSAGGLVEEALGLPLLSRPPDRCWQARSSPAIAPSAHLERSRLDSPRQLPECGPAARRYRRVSYGSARAALL